MNCNANIKYNVGDRVVIRGDLKVGELYGHFFNERMSNYLGRFVTISSLPYEDVYHIEEDNGEWFWSEEMIDHEKTKTSYGVNTLINGKKSVIYLTDGTKLERPPNSHSTRGIGAKKSMRVDMDYNFDENNKEELKMRHDYFTKTDLETGMVVKIRDGSIFLVLANTTGFEYGYKGATLLKHRTYGIMPIHDYNERLEHTEVAELDIIEVRKLNTIDEMFEGYEYDNLDLIWKERKSSRYVRAVHFGNSGEYLWKLGDIECEVGDILEVETSSGSQLVKALKVLTEDTEHLEENPDHNRKVIKKVGYKEG